MKVLVLCENYPNNEGGVSLMYIHTRNLFYQASGIDVNVLNFSAEKGYIIDGIKVITKKEYRMSSPVYDVLILHAANIKHHYRFLRTFGKRFASFVFFYHGHEVLMYNKTYPKPFDFVKENRIKILVRNCYDWFKLLVWGKYIPKVTSKSYFVFVSEWMKTQFLKWTRIDWNLISEKSMITYNCVGKEFEEGVFNPELAKEYDFLTIRSNMDVSKYAIDIVNRLAQNTPEARFLVIGRGDYFKYYKKADNIEWINKAMSHDELISYMQRSSFALMPTRLDAQGLMMCEMAAFGMPVITSDIDVCHEVFDGFENVYFIDNEDEELSLKTIDMRSSNAMKDSRYYLENTVSKEVDLLNSLVD